MKHCAIGSFAEKLGLPHQDYCKSCHNVYETQWVQHSFYVSALLYRTDVIGFCVTERLMIWTWW